MLQRAFDRFAELGDRVGQILAAGASTRACILDPRWSLLDPWIDALAGLLAGDTSALPHEVVLVGFSRLLYAAYARHPGHAEMARWTERTRELLNLDAEPTDRVFAGYSLIFVSTWSGQRALAEDVIRQVEPLTEDARLSAVGRVHWLFARANHLWRFGSAHDALAMMDRARALAASHGLAIENVLRRYRVVHLLTLDRLDDAESELDALAKAPHVEPYVELRAWLAWRRGHHAVALEEAGQALRLATERGRTLYLLLDLALLACLHADAGEHAQALEHVRRYREATAGIPGEFAPYQAGLAEAFLFLSCGDVEASIAALREALAIGERQRFSTPWAWSPRMMVPAAGAGARTRPPRRVLPRSGPNAPPAAAFSRRRALAVADPDPHARSLRDRARRYAAPLRGQGAAAATEDAEDPDRGGRAAAADRDPDRPPLAGPGRRRPEGPRHHGPPPAQATRLRRGGRGR